MLLYFRKKSDTCKLEQDMLSSGSAFFNIFGRAERALCLNFCKVT